MTEQRRTHSEQLGMFATGHDREGRTSRTSNRGFPPLGGTPGCSVVRPTAPNRFDLMELARRVERLMVSHRDPERFFVERSEIAAELRKIGGSFPPNVMRAAKAREFST